VADINSVVLVGRLTRNAELKYTNTGMPVSKISLAINKRRKKDEQWIDEVNYFDVTIWGKTAESLQPYLLKGKQIGVSGELRQSRWEQDGQSRSKVEVVATNVQLLGGGGGGKGEGRSMDAKNTDSYGPGPVENGAPPVTDEFEDDIPF
jgi:single-strand DNA-binding protein